MGGTGHETLDMSTVALHRMPLHNTEGAVRPARDAGDAPTPLAVAINDGAGAGGGGGCGGGITAVPGGSGGRGGPSAAQDLFGAPSFAAGRAFTSVTIDALLCEARFTPHLIFLIKQLVSGG